MKLKLASLILLLLLFCFTCTGSGEVIGLQTISSDVNEQPVLLDDSQDVISSENVTADNQTIILRNPTFQEMKDFILKDPTSHKTFVLYTYECRHFATEVNNNAKAAGWQCGFALLCYARGQHAVVVFNTVDRGLIFIEPQTDAAIDVKVGGTYQGMEIKEILIAW